MSTRRERMERTKEHARAHGYDLISMRAMREHASSVGDEDDLVPGCACDALPSSARPCGCCRAALSLDERGFVGFTPAELRGAA